MAAPVIGDSVVATGLNVGTVTTGNLVVGGADRALYVGVITSAGTPSAIDDVKWQGSGGTSLTPVYDSGQVQSFLRLQIWRLLAPAAATDTVYVDFADASGERGVLAIAVEDVDQTTPNGTITGADGNGSVDAVSGTIASATGETIIDFIGRFQNLSMVPDTAGQTQLEQDFVNVLAVAASTKAGAASESTEWGTGGQGTVSNWQYVLAALSLKPVTAVAATLSAPTPSGTLATGTTATIGATTNQTSGTFYAVVDTAANLAGVTATQIKAGQKASGSAALAADSNTVSTTSPTADITGLSANTLYSYAAVQNNTNGDSNVVTGTFTTYAPGASGGPGLVIGDEVGFVGEGAVGAPNVPPPPSEFVPRAVVASIPRSPAFDATFAIRYRVPTSVLDNPPAPYVARTALQGSSRSDPHSSRWQGRALGPALHGALASVHVPPQNVRPLQGRLGWQAVSESSLFGIGVDAAPGAHVPPQNVRPLQTRQGWFMYQQAELGIAVAAEEPPEEDEYVSLEESTGEFWDLPPYPRQQPRQLIAALFGAAAPVYVPRQAAQPWLRLDDPRPRQPVSGLAARLSADVPVRGPWVQAWNVQHRERAREAARSIAVATFQAAPAPTYQPIGPWLQPWDVQERERNRNQPTPIFVAHLPAAPLSPYVFVGPGPLRAIGRPDERALYQLRSQVAPLLGAVVAAVYVPPAQDPRYTRRDDRAAFNQGGGQIVALLEVAFVPSARHHAPSRAERARYDVQAAYPFPQAPVIAGPWLQPWQAHARDRSRAQASVPFAGVLGDLSALLAGGRWIQPWQAYQRRPMQIQPTMLYAAVLPATGIESYVPWIIRPIKVYRPGSVSVSGPDGIDVYGPQSTRVQP